MRVQTTNLVGRGFSPRVRFLFLPLGCCKFHRTSERTAEYTGSAQTFALPQPFSACQWKACASTPCR